jgi:hypothetical protein
MQADLQRQLKEMPGNLVCVDCGAPQPSWASVSYGTLFCLGAWLRDAWGQRRRGEGGAEPRSRAGCRSRPRRIAVAQPANSLHAFLGPDTHLLDHDSPAPHGPPSPVQSAPGATAAWACTSRSCAP